MPHQVAKVASEQFGCIEFPGIPLEDSPLGAGSHWEARIMGPEVCFLLGYRNLSNVFDGSPLLCF